MAGAESKEGFASNAARRAARRKAASKGVPVTARRMPVNKAPLVPTKRGGKTKDEEAVQVLQHGSTRRSHPCGQRQRGGEAYSALQVLLCLRKGIGFARNGKCHCSIPRGVCVADGSVSLLLRLQVVDCLLEAGVVFPLVTDRACATSPVLSTLDVQPTFSSIFVEREKPPSSHWVVSQKASICSSIGWPAAFSPSSIQA